MRSVQIEQKSYEMPPRDGFTVTYFITVADIDRSARYYEKVFGARVLSLGDTKGASGHIQIANTWLIVNVGGGPTPDKPTVTLSVTDPNHISSFMNIRDAEIHKTVDVIRVGDTEGYRRLIRGRAAANVQNHPDIRKLNVARRVAIAEAQNASSEYLFVVASRPLDVADGEKERDADSLARGHFIALLFDLNAH